MTANKKGLRVVGTLPDGAGVYCITQISTGRKQSPESIAARLEGKRKAKALREQQGATS